MVRSRSRRQPYMTPSPSPPPCPSPPPRQLSPEPRPISVFAHDGDLDAVAVPTMPSTSRSTGSSRLLPSALLLPTPSPADAPSSSSSTSSLLPPASTTTTPPTLANILSNSSPPPWTLAAFMGYLSQNHCLETLEFTMDAERYHVTYNRLVAERGPDAVRCSDYLCSLWEKLMQAYIIPCAPREVNIPSCVRDRLLELTPSTVPPAPSELDDSVEIVYELMNDSVLLPFLESVGSGSPAAPDGGPLPEPAAAAAAAAETASASPVAESRSTARTILRIPKHKNGSSSVPSSPSSSAAQSPSSDQAHSPKFLHHHRQHQQHHHHYPLLHNHHSHHRAGSDSPSESASTELPDRETLLDECGPHYSVEPMTPPTTPPTPSMPESPGGFQRVMAAHNNAWKKVVKLGFKKKRSGQGASFAAYGSGEDLSGAVSMPHDGRPYDGTPYDG